MNKLTTAHIDLAAGESIHVGEARVTLTEKSGRRARLTVNAPADMKIVHPIKNPSAHECAPTPDQGKEHIHGEHPV